MLYKCVCAHMYAYILSGDPGDNPPPYDEGGRQFAGMCMRPTLWDG